MSAKALLLRLIAKDIEDGRIVAATPQNNRKIEGARAQADQAPADLGTDQMIIAMGVCSAT